MNFYHLRWTIKENLLDFWYFITALIILDKNCQARAIHCNKINLTRWAMELDIEKENQRNYNVVSLLVLPANILKLDVL